MKRLDKRNTALLKTQAKYQGKRFTWGKVDCVSMARSHLVAMGHRKLPKVPRYKDAVGAKKALKKIGHSNLTSLFDSLLPRITPAAMLPGDIALMKGEGPIDAVVISVGRKVLGWAEGHDVPVIIIPSEIKAAWRV